MEEPEFELKKSSPKPLFFLESKEEGKKDIPGR